MADWRDDYADQNLRMAQKMLEQQGEVNALRAERDALAARLERAEAERDAMRAVVEAAEAWRKWWGGLHEDDAGMFVPENDLCAAVDTYRAATPSTPEAP